MTSLDILLENYWILKEQDTEKYESIRSNLTKEEQDFIKYKLGYKLIVNPYLIKLEKIPGIPKAYMGITEFQSKLEYVFLCLILLFLEDKSAKEQFILSSLIEFIEQSCLEIKLHDITIDFTLFKQRQAMVRVLKYIRSLGFIKLYDGEENKFAENIQNDALYEITGVSKYFVRNFTSNIVECNLYQDIYEREQLGLEQEKGNERRQRVYRRVFMENIVYQENADDPDYAYIKNYKNILVKDCDTFLDSTFEVHKNGAYIVLSEEKNYKEVFPTNRAISDVVLFVNKELRKRKETQTIMIDEKDVTNFSEIEWQKILEKVRQNFGKGFSKEFREMEEEAFYYTITRYMEEFDMVRKNEEEKQIQIMPIAWKVVGFYPKSFEEKIAENDAE